jgi:hypothetical protein
MQGRGIEHEYPRLDLHHGGVFGIGVFVVGCDIEAGGIGGAIC